ncbi:hypothetical protein HS1genome_1900 [Sulfodiicoccus acidiphilus]|uniref:Uncharacterized protein n=1 Tax=Sulfodiicoccus acidiphilus TaxID=1670455 RepID=A0A348B5Q9_9CREN|nr:hypothetical protein HS1genome_1900 [Sulfodiicoccus acidiphilus]GGT92623.1 hypothetical protein GCM10007116_07990 [Sulfodiicoccus acidiphilus]
MRQGQDFSVEGRRSREHDVDRLSQECPGPSNSSIPRVEAVLNNPFTEEAVT